MNKYYATTRPTLKRFIRGIAGIFLSIGLIACAFGSPPSESNIPEADGASTTNTPVPSAPDSSNVDAATVTTITFGAQEHHRPFFSALRVEFVAIDDVLSTESDGLPQIEWVAHVTEATVQRVDTAQSVLSGIWDIQRPYLYDLKPLMDADAAFDIDDFYPGMLDAASFSGGVYLLPNTRFVPTLSYNKELFATHGIAEPTADWTWQDMRTIAERLAQKTGDSVDVFGLLDQGTGQVALVGELLNIDPDLATLSADRATFDVETAETALRQVLAMADTGALYLELSDSASNYEYCLGTVWAGWYVANWSHHRSC
ncbi:MAG: hypothetical protein GFH27_549325n21 [Chloroflexi bacterium AL-W]|nr:hypothetical protein [Chloroflexi bacterium AL-N1]NOK70129.1 hypothetical protein [Chloroflexi bacterium AL-N10]NOK77859.1 hypothetical protein [Chloroflexi bacterium AL-N5]NOK84868.1 hypothetical protein [Chloroflexi bacterium AL-W]NOK91847.1 hypothetical protein [Chloroflexi bacterium AL-N15]